MTTTENQYPNAAVTIESLTKRYGGTAAVDDLSFSVRRGAVTGFLGPNGAGKTTVLKVIAGLARPTSGRVTIDGMAVGESAPDPTRVGVYIDACGAHPGRSGRAHLRILATLAGIPRSRADEVLTDVGLAEAARRPFRKYSMGMKHRLGLAAALLGDPDILVLDEPLNGLDPQGIRWVRTLLRRQAGQGRAVLLSSHVLAEAELTVDDVVVIFRGRSLYSGSVNDVTASGGSLESLYFDLAERDAS